MSIFDILYITLPLESMDLMKLEILIAIFVIIFSINNIIYLRLIERIFDVNSKKTKIYSFSFLNSIVGMSMLVLFGTMSALGYSIMLGVYIITIMSFYPKQAFITKFVCVLQFNVQIMVGRALISSIVAMITGTRIIDLSTDPISFWAILICTALLNSVFSLSLLKFIPHQNMRIIGKKTEGMILYLSILTFANLYLIANGNVYLHEINYEWLPLHQIIVAITWLAITYIGIFMLVGFDILRERKDELEKNALLSQVLESRSIAILEVNCTKDSLVRVIRGGSPEELSGCTYTEYSKQILTKIAYPPHLEDAINHESLEYIIEQFEQGASTLTHTCKVLMPEGEYRWVRSSISISKDKTTDDIMAIITIIDDVHEAKEREIKLKLKAQLDPLVGAYNKAATQNIISDLLQKGKIGILFMIDLDNFKSINDNFGHAYGDQVLKDVYAAILDHFRSNDVIGRIGGDEFIAYLVGRVPVNEILRKATELCKSLNMKYTVGDITVEISASVGISISPMHGNTFEELYHNADIAMYTCKKSTKNGFVIFENKH